MARAQKTVFDEEKEFSVGHRKRDRCSFIDEEDSEESDAAASKRRSAKRSRVAAFIDDEADVDSNDAEDEEDEGDHDGFIVEEADLSDEEGAAKLKPPSSAFFKEVDGLDDADLEEYFNQRYGTASTDNDLEEITDVEQQAMLPSVRDSKLFLVKCAPGKERDLAALFLQEHIANGMKSGVLSVIALDHLQNYIYIEAQREAHVREAIKGKRSIFGGKITMVPINEMTDVLTATCKSADVAINDWARIKSGTYKGDISKVVDVDNVKQRVTVKMIPRVDLEELADKLRGKVPKKRLILPPPRLMDIEKARDLNIPVKHKRDRKTGEYSVDICGMMFKDGFLIKTMSLKSISTQGAEPTFNELERFRQAGDGATTKRQKGHFMNGDTVVAVKGDLKNLKGQVEKVEDGYVHIRPKSNGLPKTIAVEEKHVCKYFEIGDHVKVGSGVHEGATGVVVKVEGDVLIVLSDTTFEDMRVFAEQVIKSSEVGRAGRSNEKQGVQRELQAKSQNYKAAGYGRDGSWIGKTVRIRGVGAYKGQRGVVKEMKGDDIRIQLDTSLTGAAVWVNRKDVSDSVEIFHPQPSFIRHGCGNQTPLRTPMRGTYVRGSAAAYERGMRTPVHCPAWDPAFQG